VNSRHQEQNREDSKAQSRQYMASWAGLLQKPTTIKLSLLNKLFDQNKNYREFRASHVFSHVSIWSLISYN
jgi:hypothetical protein